MTTKTITQTQTTFLLSFSLLSISQDQGVTPKSYMYFISYINIFSMSYWFLFHVISYIHLLSRLLLATTSVQVLLTYYLDHHNILQVAPQLQLLLILFFKTLNYKCCCSYITYAILCVLRLSKYSNNQFYFLANI